MASFKGRSFFQDIRSRELNGFRVRKRPYPDNDISKFSQIGAVSIEHSGNYAPPMALSFCKTIEKSHILAVTDEDGYVSLYNTRLKFPSSWTCQESAEKARVSEWVAHANCIFDICWIKDDTRILTASADHIIKVWDAQETKCIAALMGHAASVKSISSHPTNPDQIVSCSRDGSFAFWDLRSSKGGDGRLYVSSHAEVQEAHNSLHRKRVRHGKAAPMSITSVLYLKDEISVATAGAVDNVVKFWDIRNLKRPVIHACPNLDSQTEKKRRLHGITCLSQDLNGVFISASCMDNRIYLYNVLQLEKGPVKSFSGSRIESFFVKSALSPDAAHILGGSSDGNAYVWQVNKPQADPILLKGHEGEVTAVDWCQSEVGKIATTSDDFTACFWNIENSCYSSTRSPSSIRRRVMALPTMECRKLFSDEEPAGLIEKGCGISSSTDELSHQINSTNTTPTIDQYGTPKSKKTKLTSCLDSGETLAKTPEATYKSPSSVLNPPSSLKRTIRDYFVVTS